MIIIIEVIILSYRNDTGGPFLGGAYDYERRRKENINGCDK